MKAKVRIIPMITGQREERREEQFFFYRGYYARVGGWAAYYTAQRLRKGTNLRNVKDLDVFEMCENHFNTAQDFKEAVDRHIAYSELSHGNFQQYLRAMAGY